MKSITHTFNSFRRTLPLYMAGILLSGTAHAAIIQTHSFEGLSTGDLNGQDGFTANTDVDVESGGQTYTSGTVNSPGGTQNITMTDTSLNTAGLAFSNTFTSQTDDVYFSVSMTWTDLTGNFVYFAVSDDTDSSGLTSSAGFYFNNSGTDLVGRMRGNTSGDTTNSLLSNISTTQASTQLVVGRLYKDGSSNYNKMDLWLNPTTTTEGAAGVTITQDLGVSAVDTFYLRGGNSGASAVLDLDNISIGTTYQDVVIPEPSSLSLLAVALGTVFVWARKRKK